ncbi:MULTISPECIES: hypothetical protein [unclassified Novosphingobium]|uniref:hypothetical protein n=1 Tax=unclassified Novosphingobium TaxID=2644732 RepID=UPI00135C4FE6|nr:MULTISPECIES: hypothetical protein [unclassified Novosphingobium]
MTIRFAAAWGGTTPAIARSLCLSAPLGAVNDNTRRSGPPLRTVSSDMASAVDANLAESEAALAAALMHFARHGLSAATRARTEAETAHASGNVKASAHWLEICRQLDRRMAAAATRRLQA